MNKILLIGYNIWLQEAEQAKISPDGKQSILTMWKARGVRFIAEVDLLTGRITYQFTEPED
jgi:hypothetical protein